jgi:hypothetical protein
MTEIVAGEVLAVTFTPGRADGLMTVALEGDDLIGGRMLRTVGPEVELTFNGCRVTADQLLAHLFGNRCQATLYPRTDRYGLSTRAEFVTVP